MANEVRKPKVGDHVAAIGRAGIFEVTHVHIGPRTVDLVLVKIGTALNNVPWMALSYGNADNRKARV